MDILKVWGSTTLQPFELQERTAPFWKPPNLLYLEPRGHWCDSTFRMRQTLLKWAHLLHKICFLNFMWSPLYIGKEFSAIQIAAIALTSWDHLDKDKNFPKMYSTSLYLKGLQNCSLSKLAHTSHCLGIKPGPCGPYRFCWVRFPDDAKYVPTLMSCSFEAL